MALKLSHANNVSIYHCTAGRTVPQWEEAIAKKEVTGSLRYNEAYRRRLELLQDFEFKASSGKLHVSGDEQYVAVSGMYGPTVKVFDVEQLGMKFERHLDAEVVELAFLTTGFRKMAFLRADRTLELHAQYGKHHTVRIPKFGRDLLYDPTTCDLYVAASGADVYRLNLEQGRFLSPFTSTSLLSPSRVGSNCLAQSSAHPLLAVGREDGCVQCWDPRDRSSVSVLNIPLTCSSSSPSPSASSWSDVELTSLAFSLDGLTLACGTSHGRVALYDLRSPSPLLIKDHRSSLPILRIQFLDPPTTHSTQQAHVVSTDARSVRVWGKADGATFTAIESSSALHDSRVWPASGLVMATGEAQRVQVWYVPAMGAAPRWCAWLDSLTEELEESASTSVYDDYQFVTREQLLDWGVEHLIGSNVLRAYMHGYFIAAKLYARLIAAHAEAMAATQPMQQQQLTPAQLQRMRERTGDRILQRRAGAVAVNARYAAELMEKPGVKRRMREEAEREGEEEGEEEGKEGGGQARKGAGSGGREGAKNPLGDARFAALFKDEEFRIDEESEEYRRLHPSRPQQAQGGGRKRGREEEEEEEEAADLDDIDDRFERIDAHDDNNAIDDDDEDEDEEDDDDAEEDEGKDDDEEVDVASTSRKRKAQARDADDETRGAKRGPQMFGLKPGIGLPSILQPPSASSVPASVQREMTLEDRLKALHGEGSSQGRGKRGREEEDEEEGVEKRVGGRGRGRGWGRGGRGGRGGREERGRGGRGGGEGGREGRRGMAELLGPDQPLVARGKWARGRGGTRGGGRGGGRGGRGRAARR